MFRTAYLCAKKVQGSEVPPLCMGRVVPQYCILRKRREAIYFQKIDKLRLAVIDLKSKILMSQDSTVCEKFYSNLKNKSCRLPPCGCLWYMFRHS